MICCPKCETIYFSDNLFCPDCRFSPSEIEGFRAWAPELTRASAGFKAEFFSDLAALEATNFWFRSRNALIIWALKKYCKNFQSLMEIGCGTGFVLSGIAHEFPHARLTGTEIFVAGLSWASRRLKSAQFMQMDARRIPYAEEFDVVGAFDVLEHIAEDEKVLAEIYKATKAGGLLLLTVPQHPALWSAADDYACHVRRYVSSDIHEKVKSSGFEIVRSTSFVSLLLPLMFISRRSRKNMKAFDPLEEFQINPAINRMLETVLRIERAVIKAGVSLPAGGSRLIVARKK